MFADALKFLDELSRKAAGPRITRVEAEPDHVYYIDDFKTFADPKPRRHHAFDLDTIVKFWKKVNSEKPDDFPTVWYNRSAVVCLLNSHTRRDIVHLPISFSEQIKTILSWEGKPPAISQQSLILTLRTMFRDCLGPSPRLLAALKAVRFSVSKQATSAVTPSKVSVGRAIEAEVSGAEGIPEEFALEVPIFAPPFPPFRSIVPISIEMDAQAEAFRLFPIPGAVESAIAVTESKIGTALGEIDEGSLFYGSPWSNGVSK